MGTRVQAASVCLSLLSPPWDGMGRYPRSTASDYLWSWAGARTAHSLLLPQDHLFSLKSRAPSVETRGIIYPGLLWCTVPAQRPCHCYTVAVFSFLHLCKLFFTFLPVVSRLVSAVLHQQDTAQIFVIGLEIDGHDCSLHAFLRRSPQPTSHCPPVVCALALIASAWTLTFWRHIADFLLSFSSPSELLQYVLCQSFAVTGKHPEQPCKLLPRSSGIAA